MANRAGYNDRSFSIFGSAIKGLNRAFSARKVFSEYNPARRFAVGWAGAESALWTFDARVSTLKVAANRPAALSPKSPTYSSGPCAIRVKTRLFLVR